MAIRLGTVRTKFYRWNIDLRRRIKRRFGASSSLTNRACDLLPYFRASISLVKSVLRGEDGHEEAFFGTTDRSDIEGRGSRHKTPILKALTASYAMNASTNIGSVIYIKHKKTFQPGEEIPMNNDRIIARLSDASRICGESATAIN